VDFQNYQRRKNKMDCNRIFFNPSEAIAIIKIIGTTMKNSTTS
jgi:hypothetical protein